MFRKMYKTIASYFLFFCISLMPVWAETKAKAEEKPDLSYLKVDMPYAVARAKLIQNGWSFYDYGVKTYDQIIPACLERKFPGKSSYYEDGNLMKNALVCLYLPELETSSSQGYVTLMMAKEEHYLRISVYPFEIDIYDPEGLPVTGWRLMSKKELQKYYKD